MERADFKRALRKFQEQPELFFERVLGITTLEEYQRKMLRTIAANERTAVAACHDLGKTYTFARVVIWYALCFPGAKVITTAPTYNQVKNILWSEIRAAHAAAPFPLGGKLNLTDWQLSEQGDWFAIGFTPKNEVTSGSGQGTQSSFQGFHAPYILVLFDEATGIPHGVWTMAEGLLTSDKVKFVAIGNPTSTASEFANCFRSAAWAKVYLSCFDSPNFVANGLTDMAALERELERLRALPDAEVQARLREYKNPRGYLLTPKWAVGNILRWGLKHPLTQSKILGQFPDESDDTLINLAKVEAAQRRSHAPRESDRKIIGVDVARYGTDSTVLTVLHGKQQLARREMNQRDTMAVAGAAIALARELWPTTGADLFVVDETGLGAGVVDALREAARQAPRTARTFGVRGVQFGAGVPCERPEGTCEHKDCDKARYVNLKARMFGLLQADMAAEGGLALLDESVYLEEIPTVLYSYDSKGRMVIESKDDYKRRTGRSSPDSTDSLALANFGRYDDLTVGTFAKTMAPTRSPMAAGLHSQRGW